MSSESTARPAPSRESGFVRWHQTDLPGRSDDVVDRGSADIGYARSTEVNDPTRNSPLLGYKEFLPSGTGIPQNLSEHLWRYLATVDNPLFW